MNVISRYIFYTSVLMLMRYCGERLPRYFPVYTGASLLGFAFVSFTLVFANTARFLITQGLFEAAFAFFDLFV